MSVYDSDLLKPDAKSKEIAKEMGEDPAEKLSQIQALRTWILSHNYMTCRTDDVYLLRFLRVSKFSCEAAKQRLLNMCVMRSSNLDGMPEWFANYDMHNETIRKVIATGMLFLMPKPDSLGRLVVVVDMEKMTVVKTDPVVQVRAIYMVLHWIVYTYDRAQINGIALIELGSNNMDMELMKYWTPERMKKSVEAWQSCWPMRTKIVHYYNMPLVMKTFIELALKFMKPKLAKRIRMHSDMAKDENIPDECLPPFLGGTGPTWDDLKDDMMEALDRFSFDEFNVCKIDEAKRPKHYEEGDSWGIGGTYRPIAKDD